MRARREPLSGNLGAKVALLAPLTPELPPRIFVLSLSLTAHRCSEGCYAGRTGRAGSYPFPSPLSYPPERGSKASRGLTYRSTQERYPYRARGTTVNLSQIPPHAPIVLL